MIRARSSVRQKQWHILLFSEKESNLQRHIVTLLYFCFKVKTLHQASVNKVPQLRLK